MSIKFLPEKDDLVMMGGGLVVMVQAGFRLTDPNFLVGATLFFKGLLSCFVTGQVK